MSDGFNPYHRWLGIPLEEQPPDHYRLLGVKDFESDLDVIEHAADRQMAHLRRLQLGPHASLAERLLGEVAAVRGHLLDASQKTAYDAVLRSRKTATPEKSGEVTASPASVERLPVAKSLSSAPPIQVVQPTSIPPRSRAVAKPRLTRTILAVTAGAVLIATIIGVAFYLQGLRPADTVAKVSATESPARVTSPKTSPTSVSNQAGVSPSPTSATATSTAPPPTPKLLADANAEPQKPLAAEPTAARGAAKLPVSAPVVALVAVGAFTADEPPANAPQASKELLPVPGDAARDAAVAKVREVFAEQLKSNSTETRAELSQTLEQQGLDSKNTPEVRYAAMRLAVSLAAEGGDVERSLALLALTAQHFAIDVEAEKVEFLKRLAEKSTVGLRTKVLATARQEFDRLRGTDAYDPALAMGRLALETARTLRDREAIDEITAQGQQVRGRQAVYSAAQTGLEKLESDPGHAASHLAVGRWRWFIQKDVATGLEHLAHGSDASIAEAAGADLKSPSEATDKLALAEKWQKLAAQADPVSRAELYLRAEHWYRVAAPALGGLDKIRVEKQLTEINQLLRPSASTSDPAAVATVSKSPPKAGLAPPSTGEWKPPGKNSNATFRTFLGVYMYQLDRNKMYPVVNLQVPNRNLWTTSIQDTVRGRISFDEISYVGSANIAIPADGVYVLATNTAKVSINGLDTGGPGEVKIRKGVHVLTYEVFSHGQPHIDHAQISLREKESGVEVPFFNSWQAIQKFLNTPINGQRVLEVSNWQPDEDNEVKIDPKTLKPIAPK